VGPVRLPRRQVQHVSPKNFPPEPGTSARGGQGTDRSTRGLHEPAYRFDDEPPGAVGGLKIAAVGGDDLLGVLEDRDYPLLERPGTVADLGGRLVSANAYIWVVGILDALRQGADVVVTGRVGDPALFLAPLVHEFGWALDDWDRLGRGTVVWHLLECAGQITGGYFADPGYEVA
jgi:Acyclic terpene utilisation family protein AtuA